MNNQISNIKKFRAYICALILPIFVASQVQAIESNASVKANVILKTQTSWDGKPLAYPEGKAEITAMTVEIAPGGETGWHLHPVPSFGIVLDGELTITLKDGQVKTLHAGEVIVEVVNTLHNGSNRGAMPVKLMVFYTGVAGQTTAIKESAKN